MPHFTAQSQQDPSLPLSLFPHPFCTHSYLKCLFCSVPLLVVLTSNLIRYQRSLFDFFSCFCFVLLLSWFICGVVVISLKFFDHYGWCLLLCFFYFNFFFFFFQERKKEQKSMHFIQRRCWCSAFPIMSQRGPCHDKRLPNILVTQECCLTQPK